MRRYCPRCDEIHEFVPVDEFDGDRDVDLDELVDEISIDLEAIVAQFEDAGVYGGDS